jgi:tRNA pseudouridine32 synthase/23S rRNA pseudouridine746 synthase
MAADFSRLFRERELSKRYRVVVHGHFPAGDTATRLDSELDGKDAISHARLLRYDDKRDRSLVEVDIETGRKHQIRRHLSVAGFPVVGDRLYANHSDEENLQLSAVELRFTCPAGGGERHYHLEPDKKAGPEGYTDYPSMGG